MKHGTVFAQDGTYAGWPANHGGWQWGNEFLVGFIRGKHNIGGMHNVIGRLQKVQARSLDGGETWQVEEPNVDFECKKTDPLPKNVDLRTGVVRVCGVYDHGGEDCDQAGGFYWSIDRGKFWAGPFNFSPIEISTWKVATSRTCQIDDLLFLSARTKRHWGSDFVYCASHDGMEFRLKSVVLNDDARAVMPAVAKVKNRIVAVLRRRGRGRPDGWIDSVYSDDKGQTWSQPRYVSSTGKDNGNPPALVELDGNLYCSFANRSSGTIQLSISRDGALSWQLCTVLRKGNAPDIGYPRLFKRGDGKLVCVYYWTEEFNKPQRIEATIFDPRYF